MIFSLIITAKNKISEIVEVLLSMQEFPGSLQECLKTSMIYINSNPIIQLDFLSAIFNNLKNFKNNSFLVDHSLKIVKKSLKSSRPRILTKSLHLLSQVGFEITQSFLSLTPNLSLNF